MSDEGTVEAKLLLQMLRCPEYGPKLLEKVAEGVWATPWYVIEEADQFQRDNLDFLLERAVQRLLWDWPEMQRIFRNGDGARRLYARSHGLVIPILYKRCPPVKA